MVCFLVIGLCIMYSLRNIHDVYSITCMYWDSWALLMIHACTNLSTSICVVFLIFLQVNSCLLYLICSLLVIDQCMCFQLSYFGYGSSNRIICSIKFVDLLYNDIDAHFTFVKFTTPFKSFSSSCLCTSLDWLEWFSHWHMPNGFARLYTFSPIEVIPISARWVSIQSISSIVVWHLIQCITQLPGSNNCLFRSFFNLKGFHEQHWCLIWIGVQRLYIRSRNRCFHLKGSNI